MVISKEHRYLFIEIPYTASWSIRNELILFYGGQPILHKHATYPEFARIASENELGYFKFAAVRNPLDVTVSRYFRLRTNHNWNYAFPEIGSGLLSDESDRNKYRQVISRNITFEEFFHRYQRRPYNSILSLSEKHIEFVIRYERLQDDFSAVLDMLGLTQIRPIPQLNKTAKREKDWCNYYTRTIIPQAWRQFGPFMRRWDYDFPNSWGKYSFSQWDELRYRLYALGQKVYWRYFRYSETRFGNLGRMIRATLFE